MYRTALRNASRPAAGTLRTAALRTAPRRFASTAPADRSRSWKSSALRWGLAVAGVYYYNTSSVFADEAEAHALPIPAPYTENELPTVDALIDQKRKDASPKAAEPAAAKTEAVKTDDKSEAPAQSAVGFGGSADALEEEASQEGAFNPETGEINWDCPCLGGMAHGPCGEEFKTAFSCFVYSTEEPKGMDCIDKFQGMQECFRQYPEIYGSELEDEEAEAEAGDAAAAAAPAAKAAPSEVPAAPVDEEDRQQLREAKLAQGRNSDAAETDNLPGVKLVESSVPRVASEPKEQK
ncbi:hypothetical protein MKX08_000345 [Trichoderma sp. CBMAI-0020]|nr:hypothetical protein MKX08_000345 [Trichoderma sp. CBMAI-0020]